MLRMLYKSHRYHLNLVKNRMRKERKQIVEEIKNVIVLEVDNQVVKVMVMIAEVVIVVQDAEV